MSDETRYDPQSLNANLSRIFEKLDRIEATCSEIRTEAKKTNGRVNGLERWRDVITAKVAVISTCVSAGVAVASWLIGLLVK